MKCLKSLFKIKDNKLSPEIELSPEIKLYSFDEIKEFAFKGNFKNSKEISKIFNDKYCSGRKGILIPKEHINKAIALSLYGIIIGLKFDQSDFTNRMVYGCNYPYKFKDIYNNYLDIEAKYIFMLNYNPPYNKANCYSKYRRPYKNIYDYKKYFNIKNDKYIGNTDFLHNIKVKFDKIVNDRMNFEL